VAEPDRYATGASGLLEYHGFSHLTTAVQDRTGARDSLSLADNFAIRVIEHA
jgi:hypothetical protein